MFCTYGLNSACLIAVKIFIRFYINFLINGVSEHYIRIVQKKQISIIFSLTPRENLLE
jgi:hypothetical protein